VAAKAGSGGQRQGASLERSPLRVDCLAALALAGAKACARRRTGRRACSTSGRTASVLWPRRRTRYAACGRCAQTAATSQFWMRAARAAI